MLTTNCKSKFTCMVSCYFKITDFMQCFLMPVFLLVARLWMAKIFWYSGLTKISSWQATIYLFQYDYKVPLLPPELAAYLATTFELTCPILLFVGFATRFATLPMLAMTAVIEFTFLNLIDHFYWAMLLTFILINGAGKISLDYLIRKRLCKA